MKERENSNTLNFNNLGLGGESQEDLEQELDDLKAMFDEIKLISESDDSSTIEATKPYKSTDENISIRNT